MSFHIGENYMRKSDGKWDPDELSKLREIGEKNEGAIFDFEKGLQSIQQQKILELYKKARFVEPGSRDAEQCIYLDITNQVGQDTAKFTEEFRDKFKYAPTIKHEHNKCLLLCPFKKQGQKIPVSDLPKDIWGPVGAVSSLKDIDALTATSKEMHELRSTLLSELSESEANQAAQQVLEALAKAENSSKQAPHLQRLEEIGGRVTALDFEDSVLPKELLEKIQKRCPNVTSLSFSKIEQQAEDLISTFGSQLKKVALTKMGWEYQTITKEFLTKINEQCPNIEALSIDDYFVLDVATCEQLKNFPNLQELNLSVKHIRQPNNTSRNLLECDLASLLPQSLTALSLKDQMAGRDTFPDFSSFSKLQKLVLERRPPPPREDYVITPGNLPASLEEFTCPSGTIPAKIPADQSWPPNLKKVNFFRAKNDEINFEQLPRSITYLKRSYPTTTEIKSLAKFPALKEIDFSSTYRSIDFSKLPPSVERLNLSFTTVNDEAIPTILNTVKNLRWINLTGSTGRSRVSPEMIKELRDKGIEVVT